MSVALDDELWLQFNMALDHMANEMGVDKITPTVVLRQYIVHVARGQQDPFEVGWMEGYRAGFAQVQRAIQESFHRVMLEHQEAVEQGFNEIGATHEGRPPGRINQDKPRPR